MKTVFITAIKGINISEKLEEDLIIKPKFDEEYQLEIFLTNDKAKISKMLTPTLKTIIGQIEFEHLENANLVAYSNHDIEESDIVPMDFLNFQMGVLNAFSLALWLVKESCFDFDQCFLNYNKDGKGFIDCNSLAGIIFNSSGVVENVELSKAEVEEGLKYLTKNLTLGTDSKDFSNFNKNLSRITIGLYFLQYARQISDLGLRISTYINVFEAYFSTDNNELSHKLSERVAFFCSDKADERLEIYHKLKKAYGIRSKVFHGAGLDLKKKDEIVEISKFCDSTLKIITKKILTNQEIEDVFKKDNAELGEYFNQIIFKG